MRSQLNPVILARIEAEREAKQKGKHLHASGRPGALARLGINLTPKEVMPAKKLAAATKLKQVDVMIATKCNAGAASAPAAAVPQKKGSLLNAHREANTEPHA